MKKRRKAVHFVFKSHPGGETYMRRKVPKKVRTFVDEHATGYSQDAEPISKESIKRRKADTRFKRSVNDFLADLLRDGKKVVAGETMAEDELQGEYWRRNFSTDLALNRAGKHPTIENIRYFFVEDARLHRYRHEIIRRTIKKALKEGKVESQFGTSHSTLSRELQREGIASSREIKPQLLCWHTIIERKLRHGVKPDDIPATEYKKGFASALNQNNRTAFELITGKEFEALTDRDVRFFDAVETTMLNRLSEEQLNAIIRQRLRPGRITQLIFEFNGFENPLQRPPARKQLVDFLNKYSEHWRRLQRAKKREKARKIERKRKGLSGRF